MKYLALCVILIGAETNLSVSAETSTIGVDAVSSQRVHPVLIRNDHNGLVTVAIEVDKPGVRVTGFTFSLDGTDDLRDIESLAVYSSDRHHPRRLDDFRNGKTYAGDKQAVTEELMVPFGKVSLPANQITFQGSQLLAPGVNYFWLSCKLHPTAELMRKVDAACTRIETTSGTLAPKDTTPGVRKRIAYALRKRYDDGVHTSRIPALTVTPQGTLLCVYDLRRTKRRDLQEDIDIGLSRSTDGGRSWEPVRVIMDMGEYGGLPQNRNGCSDPGIVVDRNTGKIFCAAVWMWGKLGKHQWGSGGSDQGFEIGKSAQFLMVSSEDDGLTWSAPENLTRQLKQPEWVLFVPSPQAGITLRDGTIVLPVEGLAEGNPLNFDVKKIGFSSVMCSRDHGKTWTVGSDTARGNGECQVVELNDGSILLNSRTMQPAEYRSIYVTNDRGQTWQPHPTHRNVLIESGCNGTLFQVNFKQQGATRQALLFSNCHTQKGRVNQMIQVSLDEGQTWPAEYHMLLDEGQGNGYPSITQIDQDHVGIVYEGSQANLVFEKIPLHELLHR